jgi:hypothetical protein
MDEAAGDTGVVTRSSTCLLAGQTSEMERLGSNPGSRRDPAESNSTNRIRRSALGARALNLAITLMMACAACGPLGDGIALRTQLESSLS